MALPEFNDHGDLPEGIHKATLAEVLERFGLGSEPRQEATTALQKILRLAASTEKLERFIIFGSYVTEKAAPQDIDVILVMRDDFSLTGCDEQARLIFDHQRADEELGASVFWLCPGVILSGSLDDFLLKWGTKRDLKQRGIVEVVP